MRSLQMAMLLKQVNGDDQNLIRLRAIQEFKAVRDEKKAGSSVKEDSWKAMGGSSRSGSPVRTLS